jgi:ubiquinone/menaquinone biosynthesis C-methylase UbiE
MHSKYALAAGPAAASLLAGYVFKERLVPKPMHPRWSFTLEGKARVSRAAKTLEDIGVAPGLRALEVGCGPGVMLEAAAGRCSPGMLHAVDVQPEMVRRAGRRLARRGVEDVEIATADAAALPYPDASFDLVYMVTVLGELPDPGRALQEIRRVLRPGGTLAITEEPFDPHYMRPRTIRRRCEAAGFRHLATVDGALQQTTRFASPEA